MSFLHFFVLIFFNYDMYKSLYPLKKWNFKCFEKMMRSWKCTRVKHCVELFECKKCVEIVFLFAIEQIWNQCYFFVFQQELVWPLHINTYFLFCFLGWLWVCLSDFDFYSIHNFRFLFVIFFKHYMKYILKNLTFGCFVLVIYYLVIIYNYKFV